MTMNKSKSQVQQQQEQFADNCRYLGLKLLAEEYQQMIDHANKDKTMGYYEFIQNIIQIDAANKKQRSIEYLINGSKLPLPMKMLADFDFDFYFVTELVDLNNLLFVYLKLAPDCIAVFVGMSD